MFAFLKARAGEVTSIWSTAGLGGILAAYLLGQITWQQAIAGAAVAVIGYVMPEARPIAQLVAQSLGNATKTMIALVAALGVVALTACTPGSTANAVATAKDDGASLEPVLRQICAAGSVASGAASAVAPLVGASQETSADIEKAKAALEVACADTDPSNIAGDVKTAMALYATIVAKTPAPK